MSTWANTRPGAIREEQLEYASAYLSRERRMVFMRGVIAGMEGRWDQFSSVGIQDALMAFNHQDSELPITIIINSPGGMVSEGFVFYDAIKASIAPIVTVVQQAASMATMIAARPATVPDTNSAMKKLICSLAVRMAVV